MPWADAQLLGILNDLLEGATRRQLWLLFLEERDRLSDLVMPMADYPEDPRGTSVTADLGAVTNAHLLMQRMRMILEATGYLSIVLVWERVGDATMTDADRQWAEEMAREAQELGVSVRAQLILHDEGVRQLGLDDHGGALE